MPNLASVLKTEVSRLARKELRAEMESLKKTVGAQRADLAALKRRVQELERMLKAETRRTSTSTAAKSLDESETSGENFRFRAAGMASNRKRLDLSAADFGLLVGATSQSVYAWEAGKAKPRSSSLTAIAALRKVGKREVALKLAQLKENQLPSLSST